MEQLALDGAVDFARADLTSVLWWSNLYRLMDVCERNLLRGVLGHSQQLHLTGAASLDPIVAGTHWKLASRDLEELFRLSFPWLPKDAQTQKTDVSSMRALHESRWGKWDDPEVQRRILATAKALDDANLRKNPRRRPKAKKR